jgi:RNA polymerase sigma-70 factor
VSEPRVSQRTMFEALVRENAQALHVFVRAQLRDPGAADDVFQDTLVAAWRSLDSFDPKQPFGRWLRGIAINHLRRHRSWLGRQRIVTDEDLLTRLDEHCAALQRLRSDELDDKLQRLRSCIEALPAGYRAVVQLRYGDGLRGRELRNRLQSSWQAILKRLQRARQMLAECFRDRLAAQVEP